MQTLTNTEKTLETGNLEVIAALDACEAGHPDAAKMLIGLPGTVQIGSDHYAVEITKVTAKTITVKRTASNYSMEKFGVSCVQDVMTFRKTKWGQWTFRKHHVLSVGTANTYWSPEY